MNELPRKHASNYSAIISPLILAAALLAAMSFNGQNNYLLSLSWLALFIWVAYQFTLREKSSIDVDVATIIVLGFVVWLIVALYWHPYSWRGVNYNWRLGIYVFALLIAAHYTPEYDTKRTLYVLYAVAVFTALVSIYQSMCLGVYAEGLFLNKNNNAAFLNLFILPLMTQLLFKEYVGAKQWLAYLFFVILLFAMLQSVSRGATFSFGMVSLILVRLALYHKKAKNIYIVCALIAFTFVLDFYFSDEKLRRDLESMIPRLFLYGSIIEMIRDSNWYGAGTGMFFYNYPAYRHLGETSGGYYAHNDYLQFLYELGMPGFLLLMLIAIVVTYKAYGIVKKWDSNAGPLCLGLYAAIFAVALHSLLTFNFFITGILVVAGYYSGLILKYSSEGIEHKGPVYTIEITKKVKGLLLILVLVSGKSIVLPGYADAAANGLLDTDFFYESPDYRYREYISLRKYDPGNFRYPYFAAMELAYSGKGMGEDERRKIYFQSRKLLQDAKLLNSYSVDLYAAEAGLLKDYRDVVGDNWSQKSIALASKALAMNPRNIQTRILLARIFEVSGDKKKALKVLIGGLGRLYNENMIFYEYGHTLAAELGHHGIANRFAYLIDNFPDEEEDEFRQ